MFDAHFFKKVSQDLNIYEDKKDNIDLDYNKYISHLSALEKIIDNIIWRIKTLENVSGQSVPDQLKDGFRINKTHATIVEYMNQLDYLLSNDKYKTSPESITLLNVITNLRNKAQYSLNFIENYANLKVQEHERESNLKQKMEEEGRIPEIIEFTDQNALYKSKEVPLIDKLLNSLNYTSSMVYSSSQGLENRSLNENQKQRFDILQKTNNIGRQFLNSVNELYKYVQSNNVKLGKKTWKAKNQIGLIRSFVSEEEFTMYLNNVNQALKTLYLIE